MEYKMKHAVALTGLSRKTLYKLVAARKIPFYKAENGKTILFDIDELFEWMRERPKQYRRNFFQSTLK